MKGAMPQPSTNADYLTQKEDQNMKNPFTKKRGFVGFSSQLLFG
jgi:hypothetical protein